MISLSKRKSESLNFIRWVAALVVVVGHIEMYGALLYGNDRSGITDSYSYMGSHSHSAVMIFFVLSGYLVAYTFYKKNIDIKYTFKNYILDRWSRIYSVLLVAIIFTVVIDTVGAHLSQDYFNPTYIPQNQFGLRLLVNLFCIQGVQGYRVQLGSNPALWSIGYEFIFYIMFGMIAYRSVVSKFRFLYYAVILIIPFGIGFKMFSYFIIWSIGVLSFHLSCRYRVKVTGLVYLVLLLSLFLINHIVCYKNSFDLAPYWRDFILALDIGLILFFEFKRAEFTAFKNVNMYMAEFSYSIYAFHLPIIFFYYAVLVKKYGLTSSQISCGLILSFFCILIARVFYHLTEKQRMKYRILGELAVQKIHKIITRKIWVESSCP